MRIEINRRELSGAFGDIGTDLPLITGMILGNADTDRFILTRTRFRRDRMPDTKPLTHVSTSGQIRMVDVTDKAASERTARAEAIVRLGPAITGQLRATGEVAKGNVLETARLAGSMAAKKTADLIPLCHTLALSVVEIHASLADDELRLASFVRCRGTTGVEMEALTAVTVAALTVYDMCKAAGKGIIIEQVRLLEKTGGKSGDWQADQTKEPR